MIWGGPEEIEKKKISEALLQENKKKFGMASSRKKNLQGPSPGKIGKKKTKLKERTKLNS